MHLLFIDRRVQDYSVFVDSVNLETFPIVYDEYKKQLKNQEFHLHFVNIIFENGRLK
jgi:hypothetical protein